MVRKYLVVIFFILIGFMVYGLIGNSITGNLVKEKPKVVIYFPNTSDFPNKEEGTVVFEFGFRDGFRVGNKSADAIVFLDSNTVPGLKIGYDIKEKKVKAGLPLLSSGEFNLLDGNLHKLVYAFDRKSMKQMLYLDGNMVANGDFSSEQTQDALTGFAVYDRWERVDATEGLSVRQLID